ncbi:MAG: MOSC domain-containing protein [Aggregatilineales bacterium]
MNEMRTGHIISITFRPLSDPAETSAADRVAYLRVAAQRANLVAGHGIEGDAKAGRGDTRHLNLMSEETLAALRSEGYTVEPGAMGEQLIVSGINVDALPAGARLQLGQQAVIEITKPRTGCQRFAAVQGKPPADGRMGVMARVIEGGSIQLGDPVHLL